MTYALLNLHAPFGPNPSQRKLSDVQSLLTPNEIQDMSDLKIFFATNICWRGNLRVLLAPQRKSLRKCNLTWGYLRLPLRVCLARAYNVLLRGAVFGQL